MQRRTLVILAVWSNLQAQQPGDTTANLGPSAGIDLGIPIIEERDSLILEIESVIVRSAGQTEFIPESTDNAYPGALTQLLNMLTVFGLRNTDKVILALLDIERVSSKVVWQDPWHVGGSGCVDEFGLLVRRCPDAHSDDEGILVSKCFDKRELAVIVDFLDKNTFWELARAIFTGDSSDFVLSGPEQFFHDELTDTAASIDGSQILDSWEESGCQVLADVELTPPNRNVFYMVSSHVSSRDLSFVSQNS